MKNNNRIIFNTLITYFKSLFTIIISLLATRLLLNNLGESDFGLFNVIAGVVVMLTFLNSTMANATQRYLSFNINNNNIINKVYTSSFVIHFIIGILFILFIQIAGKYLVNNELKIDLNRLNSANILLQTVMLSTFITIIFIPIEAIILSKENFKFLAFTSTLEVVLKLLATLSLIYIEEGDRLVFYGVCIVIITFSIKLLKLIFVHKKYNEIKFNIYTYFDRKVITEITSFASWNLFGSLSTIGKNQGLAVVYNMFFTTAINAAFSIASQISSQLLFFSRTLMQTIRPQMSSSEGSGDRGRLIELIYASCKYSFMLTVFLVIPFLFELKNILNFWLGEGYPKYSELFCFFIVLNVLLYQLTIGIHSGIQSIGKIKKYQMLVGIVELLALPFTFIAFKLGYSLIFGMIFYTLSEIIANIIRLIIFKSLTNIALIDYYNKVVKIQLIPILLSVIMCFFIVNYVDIRFRFIFTSILSVIVYLTSAYYFSLNKTEKYFINKLIKKKQIRF